jgi:cytochrome b561
MIYYGGGPRLFHWTTVMLVALIIPIGWVMTRLDRGLAQDVPFIAPESLGVTILGRTVARLAWRLSDRVPPPSAALSPLEVSASGAVHMLLYLLPLVMPISDYILVVSSGFPLTHFGLAEVPRLIVKDEPLSKLAETAHLTLQSGAYVSSRCTWARRSITTLCSTTRCWRG